MKKTYCAFLAALLLTGALAAPSYAIRKKMSGFEVSGTAGGDGLATISGTGAAVTRDTILFRSGAASVKCVAGTGAGNTADNRLATIVTNGNTFYARCYVNFTSFPAGAVTIVQLKASIQTDANIKVTAGGTLQLFDATSNLQIGSDSAALTTGVWYRLELGCRHSGTGGSDSYLEMLLDGTSVASSSTEPLGTNSIGNVSFGPVSDPSLDFTVNFDDVAFNDSTGTSQNSWPGSGKIVLLKPISDNARTGWTGGAAGTTSLFDALNNAPPIGLAAASETNLSQIKDTVSSATNNYDANMTTYTSAGLVATDTVNAVQAIGDFGIAGTIANRSGAVLIVSNPVQSAEEVFEMNSANAVVSTWPTGWSQFVGIAQYPVSVTLGTSPVLRVGKRTATTNEVDWDMIGIYVDYTNLVPTPIHYRSLLGVGTR